MKSEETSLLRFDRNVSSHTIRKQLNWMSVSDRFKYLTGCLIYKCLNDCNISSSMQNTFINNFLPHH